MSARKGLGRIGVIAGTSISILVGCAIFLPLSIIFVDLGEIQSISPYAIGFFMGAGLIHFFAGTMLKHASIKKIGASRAEPVIGVTPLVAVLLAVMILGGSLSFPIAIGVGLVVAGVYFITTS
ncbi:MAG: EamA family transporter [Hadesarchaea archaeon]|nr:EamA family transporter [Hadesarchaea archaeon]